jgi:methenyltetrahydromethanopterin cyclohydrolase
MLTLNQRAAKLCEIVLNDLDRYGAMLHRCPSGATVLDLGVAAPGGLATGTMLAEICMAGLGHAQIIPGDADVWSGAAVMVTTDRPVAACMASQYAGWQISGEKYFAMGSGPMRAAAGKEALFEKIGHREAPDVAVGILETRKLPPAAICQEIAADCRVSPERLTLLVAPTASIAGTVQVAARSVETALHKLLELGYDLSKVASGHGLAPLPPVAADDMAGIGRTNDAVLYGGQVTLWVRDEDKALSSIGPQVPSSASADYGRPFGEIFASYGHDFYKIDPHLFSPAQVTFVNLASGNQFTYGQVQPAILRASFGGTFR